MMLLLLALVGCRQVPAYGCALNVFDDYGEGSWKARAGPIPDQVALAVDLDDGRARLQMTLLPGWKGAIALVPCRGRRVVDSPCRDFLPAYLHTPDSELSYAQVSLKGCLAPEGVDYDLTLDGEATDLRPLVTAGDLPVTDGYLQLFFSTCRAQARPVDAAPTDAPLAYPLTWTSSDPLFPSPCPP